MIHGDKIFIGFYYKNYLFSHGEFLQNIICPLYKQNKEVKNVNVWYVKL